MNLKTLKYFLPNYWFNHNVFVIKIPKIKNLNKKIYIDIRTKEKNKEIEKYYLNGAIKMYKILKNKIQILILNL